MAKEAAAAPHDEPGEERHKPQQRVKGRHDQSRCDCESQQASGEPPRDERQNGAGYGQFDRQGHERELSVRG